MTDTPIIALYYREHDPMKRKMFLDQSIAAGEDEEANAVRKELWELRYGEPSEAGSGTRADGYLALWMAMEYSKDTAGKLFGLKRARKEIEKNLLDGNYESEGIKVTGVIGNTTIARDNRKSQILYLNKRNIKNQILTNSADQAFKGATGIGKYGFFILNLEMPANYYDVNVHPTKMEVRFNDENKLYKVFYHAIKSSMLNGEFLDNDEKEQKKENYIEN